MNADSLKGVKKKTGEGVLEMETRALLMLSTHSTNEL
jgi:hypothetical protein